MDRKDKVEIKDEIRTVARSIMPKRKKHRAEYQMTLGSLIKALSKERTSLPVYVEFPSIVFGSPANPHSYYGYHTDLAFVPQIEEVTVAQFLEVCKNCLGKSFVASDDSQSEFYRDHTMQANTPVWVSKLDSASKLGIVDVVAESDSVTLKTEEINELLDIINKIKEEEAPDAIK